MQPRTLAILCMVFSCTPMRDEEKSTSNNTKFDSVAYVDTVAKPDTKLLPKLDTVVNLDTAVLPKLDTLSVDGPHDTNTTELNLSEAGNDVFVNFDTFNDEFECLSLCLWFDHDSQNIVAFGFDVLLYQKAVFFTDKVDAPYPNIEMSAILDDANLTSYIPVPNDSVYKFFNLKSWDAWMLVDAAAGVPELKGGLEYYCGDSQEEYLQNGCGLLISERKGF